MLSLIIMINWDKTPMKKVKFFPASLFVVLLGVALNFIFIHNFPSLSIENDHLVRIPTFDGICRYIICNKSTLGNAGN